MPSPRSPHFVSCVMSAGALLAAGSDDQQTEWLPRIASGDAIVVPAWLEPDNGFGPQGVQLRATPPATASCSTGTKWHVPFAAAAERLVVLARTGDGAEDVDLFLVDPTADGVTLDAAACRSAPTPSTASTSTVCAVPAGDRIGGAGQRLGHLVAR